jgi:hypothetical protein
MYNTTNLCYSKDLINNRDEEIKESEIFYSIYKKYLLKAKKMHLPLIVISHCPVNDWLKEGEEDSQCIYFYGHDHHNRYVVINIGQFLRIISRIYGKYSNEIM